MTRCCAQPLFGREREATAVQLRRHGLHQQWKGSEHLRRESHGVFGGRHVLHLHAQAVALCLVAKKQSGIEEVRQLQVVQRRPRAGCPRHGVGREPEHGAGFLAVPSTALHRQYHVAVAHVGQHVHAHAPHVEQQHVLGHVVALLQLLVGSRPHAFVQHQLVAHEEDGGRALQCGIRSRALPRICRLTLPSVVRPAPPRIRRVPAGMLLHHAPHAPRFGRTTRL